MKQIVIISVRSLKNYSRPYYIVKGSSKDYPSYIYPEQKNRLNNQRQKIDPTNLENIDYINNGMKPNFDGRMINKR